MNAATVLAGRLEGPAKVSGALAYEGDVLPPGMLHAALVEATIARGRVLAIDETAARLVPGFVDLVMCNDKEALRQSPNTALIQFDAVHFAGQGVAMVVAESALAAAEAARRIVVRYEEEPAITSMQHPDGQVYAPAMCGARAPAAIRRGDPGSGAGGRDSHSAPTL